MIQIRSDMELKLTIEGGTHQSRDSKVKKLSFRTAHSPSIAVPEIGSLERSSHPPSSRNHRFRWHFEVPSWITVKALELSG